MAEELSQLDIAGEPGEEQHLPRLLSHIHAEASELWWDSCLYLKTSSLIQNFCTGQWVRTGMEVDVDRPAGQTPRPVAY